MAKKFSSPRGIGKGVFWNPRFQTNCRVIYLGAGKHPSPLEKKKKKKKKMPSSLPCRKFLNYQKILFLSKVMVVFLPAPITSFLASPYLGAGKHPSPLEKKKKKKKKKKKTRTNK